MSFRDQNISGHPESWSYLLTEGRKVTSGEVMQGHVSKAVKMLCECKVRPEPTKGDWRGWG